MPSLNNTFEADRTDHRIEQVLVREVQYSARTIRKFDEDDPTHDFVIDIEEARKLFHFVNFASDEYRELIAELGSVAYDVQSPHVIRRMDGDFEYREESTNGQTETQENARNNVARGR